MNKVIKMIGCCVALTLAMGMSIVKAADASLTVDVVSEYVFRGMSADDDAAIQKHGYCVSSCAEDHPSGQAQK